MGITNRIGRFCLQSFKFTESNLRLQALMRNRISVAAAIIFRQDDRFLIARKRSGLPHGGSWEFPGGKSEPNEDPLQTVHREIMEELSMTVLFHPDCYCSYPYSNEEKDILVEFHFFIGCTNNPTPLLTDHDQTAWINPVEASSHELAPGDRPAMEFLIKDYEGACLIARELRDRGSK